MQKQTQQLVLMLIIGVLVGTTGVMAWKTRHAGEGEESVNSTPTGATTSEANFNATTTVVGQALGLTLPPQIPANTRVGLTVADQPTGQTLAVSGLTVTENHWVAVYEEKEGRPGWILGAGRVHAGDTSTQIELLRPMVAGAKYYAAILNDDGDDSFNRLTDLPPLSPERVIVVSFLAQ